MMKQGTDAQKAMVQDAVNRWWWPSADDVRPARRPVAEHRAVDALGHQAHHATTTLRQKFVDATVEQAKVLGVTLPDPDLKWNEEREHYDFGADRLGRVLARRQRRRPVQPRAPGRAREGLGRGRVGARGGAGACAQASEPLQASRMKRRRHDRIERIDDDEQDEWPLWEVFVRSKAGPRPQALRQPARGRLRRWRSSWRATSTRGARKAPASGSCARTRSSPATRATRTMYFDPMEDKVYRHPTFYELPEVASTTCEARAMQRRLRSHVARDAVASQYLLRLGDTCLILAQRLAEWCGHAPVLEEDIALTNMALDLRRPGARAADARRRARGGAAACARRGPARLPARRARLPQLSRCARAAARRLRGHGAAQLRCSRPCSSCCGQRLESSSDAELAAIAGKAVKEARYHQQHAADWVVRLGDGTDESAAPHCRPRSIALWPYTAELFEADAVDDAAAASGLGPRWADLQRRLARRDRRALLAEAGARAAGRRARSAAPASAAVHSEHMGYILAEMQTCSAPIPGGVW